MKNILLSLAASAAMSATPAFAEDAKGKWSGTIGTALQVFVDFNKATDGTWELVLSSPQQGLTVKADNVKAAPEQISFAIARFNASYSATWDAGQKAWVGTWKQGENMPLVLKRVDASALAALKPKRPQEEAIAAAPLPYDSTDVKFSSSAANVVLAGTFTAPKGKGPFPAVVLVHGSGRINRDEEAFGHKLFLVLADHLTRQGIAVLRYDKRGVAQSTGSYKDATSLDFADDAEAAVNFLRRTPEVNVSRIGIIGHSEGGMIAPLVASRDPALAFIVMLAGQGVRGELLLVEQMALLAKARSEPADQIAKERILNKAIFAVMVAEKSLDEAGKKAQAIVDQAERDGVIPPGMGNVLLKSMVTRWFHAFLSYEPGPALQAMRQPALVLNGELDLQVPAGMNLDAIRAAMKGNNKAVIKELPRMNHLFQTAKTGGTNEYGMIEETFAPSVLTLVSEWITTTTK
jgi:hypothetical protein